MTKVKDLDIPASLVEQLEVDMLKKYGPLLNGNSLREALGYRSMNAMKQSFLVGNSPVPIFEIKHRRGKFALVKDVAYWLAEQRSNSINKSDINDDKEENDDLA